MMEFGEDGVVSGDSGTVSQSQSNTSGISDESTCSSGIEGGVSLSPSFAGLAEDSDGNILNGIDNEDSLREAARTYSSCMSADVSPEMQNLERSLEDMLTRVDEFVAMLDMIRSDSSQVVNENLPEILAKASEMKQIYKKIDKLEAFVKMVGNSVAILEEQVTEAETETGPFPTTFRKFMRSISKMSSPKRKQPHYESAPIFRTEDYFPCRKEQPET